MWHTYRAPLTRGITMTFPDTIPAWMGDTPSTAEVAALLREIPTRDTPDDVTEAWIARRDAILALIAAGAR